MERVREDILDDHDAHGVVGGGAVSDDAAVVSVDNVDGEDTDADTVLHSAADDSSASSSQQQQHARVVRGRYAKFTASMDVLLLEALCANNPFTAKHGTRLQMWQQIAETVGEELLQNREAYSWHTCRDRVTTLMKLYADGKSDKLFKHGTVEENTRKESILRELSVVLHQAKSAKPGGLLRPSPLLDGTMGGAGRSSSVALIGASTIPTRGDLRSHNGKAAQSGQKRRRVEGANNGGGTGAAGAVVLGFTNRNGIDSANSLDSETFRARVLELMETKIQFDMEQRVKENELREQEFELQKRFLEYLQSK